MDNLDALVDLLEEVATLPESLFGRVSKDASEMVPIAICTASSVQHLVPAAAERECCCVRHRALRLLGQLRA